jgi:hypothetical protein
MSGGPVCHEHGREHWVVIHYRHNHSAFNGYRWTPSDYSAVTCDGPRPESSDGKCGTWWRTKARYVEELEHEPCCFQG